jgi:malonyl-CoA decarboxylase
MSRVWVNQMFGAIADLGRQYFRRPGGSDPVATARALLDDLLSEHGEASGTALAREAVDLYSAMDEESRLAVLDILSDDFAVRPEDILRAAEVFNRQRTDAAYRALRSAVESPRQELLRRLNMAPGGTKVIVEMRELVLENRRRRPGFRALNDDLFHLLTSWFNRGFLQFERIDWRTSAAILEKLIAYEAVHEIEGWEDLRRRLGDDRRCFAFFHPALPDEPLIFVQVALTRGLAGQIRPLLDEPSTDDAGNGHDNGKGKGNGAGADGPPDTATFYSISNCQAGLAGISFGNFLIKQVVDDLRTELPSIARFVTLSPIPGFCDWLVDRLADPPDDGPGDDLRTLAANPDWLTDAETRESLQSELVRLCVHYLVREANGGGPRDPVARFHLGNGASIERINWAGDLSDKGLVQSAGIMVNYAYDLDAIIANHEAFVNDGKIALSSQVRGLLTARRG